MAEMELPEVKALVRKLENLKIGTEKQYETTTDMWFFELFHALDDAAQSLTRMAGELREARGEYAIERIHAKGGYDAAADFKAKLAAAEASLAEAKALAAETNGLVAEAREFIIRASNRNSARDVRRDINSALHRLSAATDRLAALGREGEGK